MADEPRASPGLAPRPAIATGLVAGTALFALALVRIGRSFGYDEGFTYHFFIDGGSPRRALTTQIVFNNHPMFSTIQAAAWRAGLTGETAQRLGPAIAAAVTVGLVAWFTSRRVGVVGGAAAASFLTLNAMYLDYARQLRGYALASCAVVVAAVLIWRSWSDPRHRWLVAQGVAMVVAVTTHSYSAVTLAALALAALVLGRVERRHLLTWTASAVVALVIMAPILDDVRRNAEARGNRYWSSFPTLLLESLTTDRWLVTIVVVALVAAGCWRMANGSRRTLLAMAAGAGVVVVTVVVLWQVIQPRDLYPRFFISLVPFVAILVGYGVSLLPRPAGAAVAVGLAIAMLPGALDRLDVVPRVRETAALVDRARAEGLMVCGYQAQPLLVYTAPMPFVSGLDGFGDCDVYVNFLGMTADRRDAAEARYGASESLGGILVWADADVLADLVE